VGYNQVDIVGACIGKIVTMLGWDGTYFRAVHIDAAGDLQADVLSIPQLYPGLTNVSLRFSAGVTAHGWTVRATYTVPANKRAILTAAFTNIDDPGGVAAAVGQVRVNDIELFDGRVDSATPIERRVQGTGYRYPLVEDDAVTIRTFSTAAGVANIEVGAHIVEYDV